MCPQCQATYAIDTCRKRYKELLRVEKILTTHKHAVNLLDDMPLERGIVGGVTRISKLG